MTFAKNGLHKDAALRREEPVEVADDMSCLDGDRGFKRLFLLSLKLFFSRLHVESTSDSCFLGVIAGNFVFLDSKFDISVYKIPYQVTFPAAQSRGMAAPTIESTRRPWGRLLGVFAVVLLTVPLPTGAPPTPISGRPPEDIVCDSNSIYGFVDTKNTIQKPAEAWFNLEVASPNLQECVRRCYGYRFCYSVTYDHTKAKPCNFFLHRSDSCGNKELVNVNTLTYSNRPITVGCLKCGDAPVEVEENAPQKSELPAIDFNEDAAPESVNTADSELHDSLEDDEKHDHSQWSPIVEKQRACPDQTHEIAFHYQTKLDRYARAIMINESQAASPEACARLCYLNHCDFAQFELDTHICAFSVNTDSLDTHCEFDDSKIDGRSSAVTVDEDSDGVEMSCIACRRRKTRRHLQEVKRDDGSTEASTNPLASKVTVASGTNLAASSSSTGTVHVTTPNSDSKDDNLKELENASKAAPAPPAQGYGQSCVVTFQVFKSDPIDSMPTTHVATVNDISQCAYICYQNSCSGAVFVPAEGDKKAQCKVQMKGNEKCSGRHIRHYFFKTEQPIVLSCFRCEPKAPATLSPDAEFATATTTPQPHLVSHELTETTAAPASATQTTKAPMVEVNPTASKTEPQGPAITNSDATAALKPDQPAAPAVAPTTAAPAETTTTASETKEAKIDAIDEAAEKAKEAIEKAGEELKAAKPQDDAPAKPQDDTPAKPETATPAHPTDKPEFTLPPEVPPPKFDNSLFDGLKAPEQPQDKPGKMVDLGTVTTAPVVFGGGCLITFQADYLDARPAELTSGFELNLNTETVEICATRCFQDGCTGALFFPKNGSCVLGYGDKHVCNRRPLINFLNIGSEDTDATLWLHCTSCRGSKHGAGGAMTGNLKDNKVVTGSLTMDAPEDGATTTAEKVAATEATTTTTSQAPTTTAEATTTSEAAKQPASKDETAPTTVAPAASEGTTTAPETKEEKVEAIDEAAEKAKQAIEKAGEDLKNAAKTPQDDAPVTTTTTAAAPASATSKKPTPEIEEESGAGCLITFQAGDLADRPKHFTSEFELNLNTETAEICAVRCYQDGCTGALFFPKNGSCVLGYGDNQYCDRSPIFRFYKPAASETPKESIWIHCTVCRAQKHGETFANEAVEQPESKAPPKLLR
uniref:Apple domain-containing protein n=1 Tax=Panagrellus redivivus TaxID=6233 RepID=A0A7E4ULQ4_PANRE